MNGIINTVIGDTIRGAKVLAGDPILLQFRINIYKSINVIV